MKTGVSIRDLVEQPLAVTYSRHAERGRLKHLHVQAEWWVYHYRGQHPSRSQCQVVAILTRSRY